MLNAPNSQELPMYLPEDVEAFGVIRGIPEGRDPAAHVKGKGKYQGRQYFILKVEFAILDGEFANMIDRFDLFVQVDNGEVYGDNTAISQLWDSAGIKLGENEDGETVYPWPETPDECISMIENEGEYELRNLGLKNKLFRFKTGKPKENEFKGKTYVNTNIVAFRTISDEDREEVKPILGVYLAENAPF